MKVVLVTAPAEAAENLARTLVDERLAACVAQVRGVVSTYRWNGAVERAEETQLVVKTSDAAVAALVARVRALHPYETPEIVVLDAVWVLPEYARWVDSATLS